MEFKIIEKREKSFKMTDENNFAFFIQKRWLNKKGELTPAGVKAYNSSKEEREYNNSYTKVDVAWQSEKAIGVDFYADFAMSSSVNARTKRVRLFFPKSTLNTKNEVPNWLLNKKVAEADVPYGYALILNR
jgi:hypothetical protein